MTAELYNHGDRKKISLTEKELKIDPRGKKMNNTDFLFLDGGNNNSARIIQQFIAECKIR